MGELHPLIAQEKQSATVSEFDRCCMCLSNRQAEEYRFHEPFRSKREAILKAFERFPMICFEAMRASDLKELLSAVASYHCLHEKEYGSARHIFLVM